MPFYHKVKKAIAASRFCSIQHTGKTGILGYFSSQDLRENLRHTEISGPNVLAYKLPNKHTKLSDRGTNTDFSSLHLHPTVKVTRLVQYP